VFVKVSHFQCVRVDMTHGDKRSSLHQIHIVMSKIVTVRHFVGGRVDVSDSDDHSD